MKLTDIKPVHSEKPILLLMGRMCSGKGTICKSMPNRSHIVISDIVKHLIGATARSDLQNTSSLDTNIAEAVIGQIKTNLNDNRQVVIDGIRQKSIIQAIVDHFGDDMVDLVWLDVPTNELRKRYHARAATKDDNEFETALSRDESLGIGVLETYLKSNPNTKIINNWS